MERFTFNRQAAKKWVKCISFLLLFVLLLSILSNLLLPKNNDPDSGMRNHVARGFYGEPGNSLDVIGIGNSNMASGFSPLELWKAYGYTGYDCGESGQNIFQAYNMLSEVLTCQKPKVVFLETDGIFPSGGQLDTFNRFMHFNLARYFPIVEYHDLWKITRVDTWLKAPKYTWTSPTKGYWVTDRAESFSGIRPPANGPAADLVSPDTRLQLDMFRRLCQKNQIHLVLIYLPTAFSWDQKRHDTIAAYAAAHGLPFLDFNTDSSSFGLNWKTDSRDGGIHLNYFGAMKISQYFGSYLQQHGILPGHHNAEVTAQWDRDFKDYKKVTTHFHHPNGDHHGMNLAAVHG